MPILYEPVIHRCWKPNADEFEYGTLWECAVCLQCYQLCSTGWDGERKEWSVVSQRYKNKVLRKVGK